MLFKNGINLKKVISYFEQQLHYGKKFIVFAGGKIGWCVTQQPDEIVKGIINIPEIGVMISYGSVNIDVLNYHPGSVIPNDIMMLFDEKFRDFDVKNFVFIVDIKEMINDYNKSVNGSHYLTEVFYNV